MTSLEPRGPYTSRELENLFPRGLQLQLVQVLLRHGERSPVSPRFQHTGLKPYWPYCNAARQLTSVVMTSDFANFDQLRYRRRLETFGNDDEPMIASGPKGEYDAICQPGELTDKGRETTLALGQRLRNLYVDQLGFMPHLIADSDMIYLRATPIPRALESVQQTFWGMYPPNARTVDFPAATIVTRTPADETLFPNDGNCRRLARLSRAFAQRTADRWNDSDDMRYLNKVIGKHMPEASPDVAVDSHPRLSGIMDTINSTLAHGPETRLPSEFYDKKARAIIDKIGVEEWFSGYKESNEYRALGIGGLAGDIVSRMVGSVEQKGNDGLLEIGGHDGKLGRGRGGESSIKFALSGCHDTTLAGFLTSLGAFENEPWPPYTSHIAVELFRNSSQTIADPSVPHVSASTSGTGLQKSSWWSSLFGSSSKQAPTTSTSIVRKPTAALTDAEKSSLDGYFVRIRYNDRVMSIPGCNPAGKHLEGDESFCTLAAFKSIVNKYTPHNWKQACTSNIEAPEFPAQPQPAGYE